MEGLSTFLLEQKAIILNSLDKLSKTASSIVIQKNNKILFLNKENESLNEKTLTKFTKKNKSILSINELHIIRKNNKLLKKLIKKENEKLELKQNIIKIQKEADSKDFISTKDMAAFKIVALDLEEKEKAIKNNINIINKLENEKNNLLSELEKINLKKLELENQVNYLENKNKEIESINNMQINTIETITKELQNKNEKIMELKKYFIEILDNYNDLLQMVDQKCN